MRRLVAPLTLAAALALAAWCHDGLGAGLMQPVRHGPDEDWDWQLTLVEASRQALAEGRLPTWNPAVGGGQPLLANPECPALYPPALLLAPLGADAALRLLTGLHLGLLVVGAWVAGRRMGLSPVAAHGAALFSLGSAFLPEFLGVGHVMFLALGWLPLAWCALDAGRWRAAAALLALPVLAGGHYLLPYGLLWLALAAVFAGLAEQRLRWLALPLALNGLTPGLPSLALPLGLALALALTQQRPEFLRQHGSRALAAMALCALLLAPKLLPMLALAPEAARLQAGPSFSVADPMGALDAWGVLTGALPRPSGHEGPNVFGHPAPVLLGLAGLGLAAWRHPRWGLIGLVFWSLAWSGATPLNLAQGLHRLPGFGLLRVIERYHLVATLFLGWGAGLALDLAWRWRRWAGLALGLTLLPWAAEALPRARVAMHVGAGEPAPPRDGPFEQVRGPQSAYHALLRGQGMPERGSALGLPPVGRAVGDPDHLGLAWTLEGRPLPASLGPGWVALDLDAPATVLINQRADAGWSVGGLPAEAREGLLSARLPAGHHRFEHRPAPLPLALGALGLALLVVPLRRR